MKGTQNAAKGGDFLQIVHDKDSGILQEASRSYRSRESGAKQGL